jgi:hypothetical protein
MISRCDALKYAAAAMLEQFRPLLDGPTPIKSIALDLKLTQENVVHTALLSPEFQAHPAGRPVIERYDFPDP